MKFMQTTRFLLLAMIGRNWQFVSTIFCNPLVHRMGTMVKIYDLYRFGATNDNKIKYMINLLKNKASIHHSKKSVSKFHLNMFY